MRGALAALSLALAVSACARPTPSPAPSPAPSPTPQPVAYDDPLGLSLLHPPDWNAGLLRDRSRFLTVSFLASQPIEDQACRQREVVRDPVPDFPYEWPIGQLLEGGTLLAWWQDGFDWTRNPGWSVHLQVGGRPAIRRIDRPGPCAEIAGGETVTLAVADPGGRSWVFVACLRGPDLQARETVLTEVFGSVRFR